MKVRIEKDFPMPGPADAAWALLQDIQSVAGCMPGAKITERIGDDTYRGTVAVRFGPANMSFRGEVQVGSLDAATRTLRLVGKGTDTTGGSGASMDLTAHIEAVDAATSRLLGSTEVTMSGKAAAFGSRLMVPVADQVLKQFADNFAAKVQALQSPATPAPAVADGPAATPAPGNSAAQAAPSAAAELNGLALAWVVIKAWLRSFFGARKA